MTQTTELVPVQPAAARAPTLYDSLTRFIARSIGFFAPGVALRYLHNQKILTRAYNAAKTTGPNQGWQPKATSAHQEVAASWRKTTDRARALERDNPYITGLRRRWVSGVVGEGTWPKAKVLKNSSAEIDTELCLDIENRWEAWQETASANGDPFTTIQAVVASHFLIDGEALVRRLSVPGQALALEVVEADQLDTGKDAENADGSRVAGGIALDRFGKPTGYWLFSRHPSETATPSVLIPASEVLHIFDRQRASQVRGICHFASVVNEIFDTVEYQDATLVLARVATAFGVFIETTDPDGTITTGLTGGTGQDGTPAQYINPGSITHLRPGEKIGQVQPENPGAVYDPYVRSRLRGASVGAGSSYESFSNDYSQATYSSARQAMLLERALYRFISGIIDKKLNIPVYRWFIECEQKLPAGNAKPLRLPGYEKAPRPFWRVKFSRPRQEWIDPLKEANAAQTRLDMNLDTLTELCEDEGRDIDDVLATRAAEVKKMKTLGIWNEPKQAATAQPTPVQEDINANK